MTEFAFFLADEAATLDAGKALAEVLRAHSMQRSLVVYLHGHLGAGKTTLCRGLLHALGHRGAVKSPTYTLVEPYELSWDTASAVIKIYHFDLYRLHDAQELEFLGVQEYFDHGFLCLVEWPERGLGLLPDADILVALATEATGRHLSIQSGSSTGDLLLKKFSWPEK